MNVYCNCNLKNQLHGIINDLVITDYHRKIIEERFLKEVIIYGAGDSGEKIAIVLAETELTFHKTIVY